MLRRGLYCGRIAGVPIYLARSWFVLTLLIVVLYGGFLSRRFAELAVNGYVLALIFALFMALSVFVHELCHALTARSFGWRVGSINLTLWGGHTSFTAGRDAPGRSALVSLAGPAANLVIAGLGWALTGVVEPGTVGSVLLYLVTITNGLVGVFNLLPGIPLDGGHAVAALVWKATGSRDAGLRTAAWLGLVLSLGVVAWVAATGIWRSPLTLVVTLLVVFFLASGAVQTLRAVTFRKAVGGLTVGALARPTVPVRAHQRLADLPPLGDARGVYLVTDERDRGIGVVDRAALAAAGLAGDDEAPAESLMVQVTWDRPLSPALGGDALAARIAQLPGRIWPVYGPSGTPGLLFEADVIEEIRRRQSGR
ncbi:site-2 protease family protein [Rothia sp. AR01]|uniref:Site-2 protease family protein n=1 Tax=Rothia santali TaxID=2949643 RepID=A0A9X2HHV1_9MICC|nr:site-2 protease family protein [Rothia santali]MCP3424558.1 site-2 protease family protein [Rothia santali]